VFFSTSVADVDYIGINGFVLFSEF